MLPNKDNCCGCSACESICPKRAIKLLPDKEGFLYPVIDEKKCVRCGLCSKVCPINQKKERSSIYKIYAGYIKEEFKLKNSASGGIATALYEYFLNNHGVVFGVKWSSDFRYAEYTEVTDIENLNILKSSKYIQTEKNGIYKKVREELNNDKKVLFVGLPCDIAGLKNFLNKEYENLYTCSLVCMGPTSPSIIKQYIDILEERYNSRVLYFNLRDKINGWGAPNYIRIVFENKQELVKPFNETEFGSAFEIFGKPSCTNCKFKLDNSKSDIIIGDYWGVNKYDEIYNKYGVSTLIVHSEKMDNLIKRISSLKLVPISYENAIKNNINLLLPRKENFKRNIYSKNFISGGLKYAHSNIDSRFIKLIKKSLLYKIYYSLKRR